LNGATGVCRGFLFVFQPTITGFDLFDKTLGGRETFGRPYGSLFLLIVKLVENQVALGDIFWVARRAIDMVGRFSHVLQGLTLIQSGRGYSCISVAIRK
jgi:hypothetical protein